MGYTKLIQNLIENATMESDFLNFAFPLNNKAIICQLAIKHLSKKRVYGIIRMLWLMNSADLQPTHRLSSNSALKLDSISGKLLSVNSSLRTNESTLDYSVNS